MATTVTPAIATITLSENITLNGVTYGNAVSKSFGSQGEVIQRIMSIATSFTDIFHTSTVEDHRHQQGALSDINECSFAHVTS